MNKKLTLLALALVAAVFPVKAGVKEIGTINGVRIVRIKTAGLFAPSTTTIVAYDPTKPGVVEVLNNVGGPGLVPAVATAGGVVGGAALLRPARVNNGSNSTATGNGGNGGNGGNASSTGGGNQNGSIHHNN